METRRVFGLTELVEYFEERLGQEASRWLNVKTERDGAILQGRAQVWSELRNIAGTFAAKDEQEAEKRAA